MIIVPKIEYLNFFEEFKDKICVYMPSRNRNELKLAMWYSYDISHYLDDGLKRINRLGSDSARREDDLLSKNNLAEIQTIMVKSPSFENRVLLDVVAYTHYKQLDKENYGFLEDHGEFVFDYLDF